MPAFEKLVVYADMREAVSPVPAGLLAPFFDTPRPLRTDLTEPMGSATTVPLPKLVTLLVSDMPPPLFY